MCAAPPPALAPRFDTSQIEDRLSEIDKRFLEPLIKKAADNFYCQVLGTVDEHLLENLDYNMTSHVRMLERENDRMRTELWDVDRALGCLSMGHETRLNAIKETNQRFNQATNECWRLRAVVASLATALSAFELEYLSSGLRETPEWQAVLAASADTRRMAETTQIGSVRSTSGAASEAGDAQ